MPDRPGEILWADDHLVMARTGAAGAGGSVLSLTPAAAPADPTAITHLHHAFALRDELDPTWATVPTALLDRDQGPVLVLDDPGGEVLATLIGRPWSIDVFLPVAIGLAGAVGKLHARGLLHKDIKPAHVLVDRARGAAWLTGFGIASRLPRERQAPAPAEILTGTPAYMAPEQTGRMNRSIDSRSDLYSVGVTLYELLAGAPPFRATTAAEWFHGHIARAPLPLPAAIPEPIAAIVLKLLAKAAEDRYQTAAGLEADLRRCAEAWRAEARIDRFALARDDHSDRLRIPETLYGRDAAIARLGDAYQRVATTGLPEVVLVSGYAGVGKSSLVSELHRTLVPSGGLFATGKFDQYRRDIPHAPLAQAFQGLVRQILAASEAEVARWRDALRAALGAHAQLIVAMIPDLELIIGPPPAVPEISPQDARTRFQAVFRRFVAVFARPEHPLVLFLDDLQWLERSTLELLECLVTARELGHALVIAAYRDHEVGPDHALHATLAAIRIAGPPIHDLVLAPLTRPDLTRLVADALQCEPGRAVPLAQLLLDKTGGNPFFAIQFLTALVERGLVGFDPALGAWAWDLERIRSRQLTDNVVDLMTAKLTELPVAAQELLRRFACLGNRTHAAILALVAGASDEDLDATLWAAVRAGLILRIDDHYAFLHDRVQQAAYELIPDDERAAVHVQLGRRLAAATVAGELEERIFEIVDQLARGAAVITDRDERLEAAGLALIAARRARAATAYTAALSYIATGRGLLPDDGWATHYPLAFALELHGAACEFATGDPAAEPRLAALAGRAATLVDLAAVTCLQIDLFTSLRRSDHAVEAALAYLRRVGFDWSAHPSKDAAAAELDRIWAWLGDRRIASLVDLPEMTAPEWRATLDVLTSVQPPALFTDEHLHSLVVGRMTNLSLEHGNSDGSGYAYAVLGVVLGASFGDHRRAYEFGKLGFDLVEQRGLDRFEARVYMSFGAHVSAWVRPLRDSLELVRRAAATAQATGDLAFIAYTSETLVTLRLALGDPLDEVQAEAEQGLAFARAMRFDLVADIITGQLRLIRTLRGLTPRLDRFDDDEFGERAFEAHFDADPGLAFAECWYWIRKLEARVHARAFDDALAAAGRAARLLWTSPGHFEVAEYHLFAALAHAGSHDTARGAERAAHLDALAAHHAQIAAWAATGPETFAYREALVGAERARCEGRPLDALDHYERALRLARDHGFRHHEALIHELAARFHAGRGHDLVAQVHATMAQDGYARWGALGKARQLARRERAVRDARAADGTRTIGARLEHLDLETVLRVSQALSAEIVLESLIERLMTIAVEHAGASRGVLILATGETTQLEAEATAGPGDIEVRLRPALPAPCEVPASVVRYVLRTREAVLLDDAAGPTPFAKDPYFARAGTRSVLCVPLVKQAVLVGVLYLENHLATHAFTPGRVAVLELLAVQAAISLDNARLYADVQAAEDKLRRTEREIRLIVDTIPAMVWAMHGDGSLEFVNQHWLDYTGLTLAEASPSGWEVALHPDDAPGFLAQWQGILASGQPGSGECRVRRFDGTYRWYLMRAQPVRDERGALYKWYGTNADIDDLKRAEAALRREERRLQSSLEEKEALLREVHHRVKNNLQLISSLLNLQAARNSDRDVAELLADSRSRVRSMALVHENLYRAGNLARIHMEPHVRTLCEQVHRAYQREPRIAVTVSVEDVHLDIDRAVSCGLIINELVSNALKHAFPGERAGTVSVTMTHAGAGYLLVVRDDGVGLPGDLDLARIDTMGLQLVCDLTDQLGGTLAMSRAPGAEFAIAIPAGQAGQGSPTDSP